MKIFSASFNTFLRVLLLSLTAVLISACSSSGRVVDHAFGFDILRADPAVEVLDYSYGLSKLPVRADPYRLARGDSFYFNGVNGPMLVGDFLYVKWRIKSTGAIFEKNVDLRHRLPSDMKGQRVYFDIKGPQLYVYLVSPEPRPKGLPPNGPRKYQDHVVKTIYPD